MPTYITIKFDRDYATSKVIRVKGKTLMVWETLIRAGEELTLCFGDATYYVKKGYASYC